MDDDEYWIDPAAMDGHTSTIRACFNDFSVTITVARKDGKPISAAEAEHAWTSVIARMPDRVWGRVPD